MTMEIFRFLAKAQNDKIFVILICLVLLNALFVILSLWRSIHKFKAF